ncbi:M20/M25/M40 family metallo-hydrolase [Marinilabiliaceae bacterium JC017]|nr:M20/M25/M40 family metallo-hydrolase [Marinilabiliaceae bacterium JC017]
MVTIKTISERLLSRKKSLQDQLLETVTFQPETVCKNFTEITKISHPSGQENPIRKWVIAKSNIIQQQYTDNRRNIQVVFYDPDALKPGKRVIVLRRAGSGDYKGQLPVILQAHMDMVTVPSENIFPLQLGMYTEDNKTWLKAYQDLQNPAKGGTTLGADDGIGVATILAIMEDSKLKDIPIECFFTVQEETNMGGAKDFNPTLLTGNKYINLDAEDLNTIIYGSAGGSETSLDGSVTHEAVLPDYQVFDLSISGLQSGHSGIDINKGRLNAIKVLADILTRLNKRINNFNQRGGISSYNLRVHSIRRSDVVKANSIPSGAAAQVSVPKTQSDAFSEDFRMLCELNRQLNQPVEWEFTYSIIETKDENISDPMSAPSTDTTLLLLNQLPHGVIKMIPTNPSLVETSTNLYNIAIQEGKVAIHASNRSSNAQSLEYLNAIQENTARIFCYTPTTGIGKYPAWQPDESSALLKDAKAVYAATYGQTGYNATVIHAGLECGWIIQKYGGKIECISVGPTIQNPHTENERLEVKDGNTQTVQEFYEVVSKIIVNLYK